MEFFLSMMQTMFVWDGNRSHGYKSQRLTATETKHHPYVSSLYRKLPDSLETHLAMAKERGPSTTQNLGVLPRSADFPNRNDIDTVC